MTAVDAQEILRAVLRELRDRPPTIGVIGLSGVGKSSTINAMFGTSLPVSSTIRGTAQFIESRIPAVEKEVFGEKVQTAIHVFDAPGLGEDMDLDDAYKRQYKNHLRKCDVALWVLAGRNRALALDQRYLAALKGHLPNLVVGINQVDLVDPVDWNEATNLPSPGQRAAIEAIVADRGARMQRILGKPVQTLAYSATRYYGLHELFLACLANAPDHRRWMFDLVRSFTPLQWAERATGLTDAQRATIVARYRRKGDGEGLEGILKRLFR